MNFTKVEFTGDAPLGITYIVTEWDEVFWWPFYTRHRWLADAQNIPYNQIVWGGILDPRGQYVRGSYDFGDAPNAESLEHLIQGITKDLIAS